MKSWTKSIKTLVFLSFLIVLLLSCNGQLPEIEELPAAKDLPEQLTLPDPFIMIDGTRIETQEDWYSKRRPELKKLFQHYVFGYLPPAPEMTFEIVKTDPNFFDGKATYKEVVIHMLLPDGAEHKINLALFVPTISKGPAPVFIGVNKCGNHMLVDNDAITIVERDWVHESCS